MDTFKNNLFGQLKNYGDAVQGAFEQRIARPLLALKRDLSRPSSSVRQSTEQDSSEERSNSNHDPLTPTSSPIEIESNGPLKILFDKVKTTLSSSSNEPSSSAMIRSDEQNKSSSSESRHLSISSDSSQDPRNNKLRQQKSVSFADTDSCRKKRSMDRIHHRLSDPDNDDDQLHCSTLENMKINSDTNESTFPTIISTQQDSDDNDDDFRRQFYQSIKPRRISIGNCRDLVYQDLSAEIVAYILKHALRSLEEEDEQLELAAWEQAQSNDKQMNVINADVDDDFIDLK